MSNFNYYLNRQGSRGRQGVKGDKGEAGYSPYIDIKSNTPTEFIMTIHNETESFDTPNLIPTAIGEKVTEMDAVLTTHTEDIANLKLEDQNIKNKNTAQDSDIAALKTRVGGTEESIEDLNHKYTVLGSEVSDLTLTKQNRLVEGANITLTDNSDGTTTISASGGGGGGSDVPIATTQVAGKVKPDGTTITITDDGTISSVGGGGGTPENMMTIDTNQTVSGVKTFTNRVEIGISGLESRITTTNNNESGQRQDLSIVSSGDLALSTGNVAFTDNDGGSHVRQGKITDGSGNIVLTQGNVTAGNNITITKTNKGIQIASSGGGSSAPENMVTTDTDQDIKGVKRFLNNRQDLSKPAIKIGSYAAGQDNYDGGYITTGMSNLEIGDYYATNSKGGFLSINSTADSSIFKITSNNSNINPRLQLGTHNYEGEIYNDVAEGLCLSNRKYNYNGQRSILKIKNDTLTFKKTDGTVVDLLAGGSAPANMVTTDTDQFITGTKSFYGSINLKGSETDNYYSMITNTGGSIKLQAQYGNPAGLNVGVSSLTYTDASGIDHNLLSSGATIDDSAASDTSTYSSSKIEKLTNITSSDASISITKSGTGIDIVINKNEWVYVNKQLLNNVDRTKENITIDLSNDLPNDGATYEVLFSSMAQPTVEKNKFCAVIVATTEISPGMRVAQGRVAVAGVDAAAYGTFLLPITSSRSMLLGGSASSNNGGVVSLWMHAYKKIG